MTREAISPVMTNTKIIADRILLKRRILVMAAIAEEMEKKTSGTIVVNRRLRKISPNGLRTAAFCLNTIPRKAPIKREKIKMMGKPYEVTNRGNLIFIFAADREIKTDHSEIESL